MKKSIAFFCCTNGYGHYKRVYEVSKHLIEDFDITIHCNKVQADKIGRLPDVRYKFYRYDNIRWDKIVSKKISTFKELHLKWSSKYGPEAKDYDLVISDNIAEILTYRSDAILMGSFLWKDVIQSYLGDNSLSARDQWLIDKYNPVIITNKYVETQSVKTYKNKAQFGFGCENQMMVISDTKHTILQYPSLSYLSGYNSFLDSLLTIKELGCTKDLSYIYDTRMIARPGVGTITHCVEHNIPLIALYSNKDSKEIVELAHKVEELGIGYKQDIDKPFNYANIKPSNVNYCYANKLEKEGYSQISKYIKTLI